MAADPARHHAYGPHVDAVVAPAIYPLPPQPVVRCGDGMPADGALHGCGAIWTHGHEHVCPHGGVPPSPELASRPPQPWGPKPPQWQGDTKYEQDALEEARREWPGMSDAQRARARGVHSIVRHPEGGFHLETVITQPAVPTADEVRAEAEDAAAHKKAEARATREAKR